MFGPLPRMYRILVIVGALLLSVAGGAWLAYSFALELPFGGVLLGVAFGVLIAFALVHDFSHGRRAGPIRFIRHR